MFCKHCGKEVQDGVRFCPECGATVDDNAPNAAPTDNSAAKKPQKKKGGCLKVVLIVLGVFVVLIIVAAFLSGKSSSSESMATETQNAAAVKDETKAEQTTKQTTEQKTEAAENKETFIASCERVVYDDVSRNPSDYEKRQIAIEGTVIQVSEVTSKKVVYRIAEENAYSGKTWYVEYTRSEGESRILEQDYVTAYGTCDGLESYTAIMGNTVSIPKLKAKYIDLGKVVNGKTVVFDAEKIAKGLEVEEYRLDDTYFNYYFLSVKNTSDYEITVTANINFYDSDNKLVGAKNTSIDVLAPGMEGFMYTTSDEAYDHAEYELSAAQSEYYKDGQEMLSYETSETDEKVIVSVTNNGDEAVSFAQADILFFDENGKVIGHNSAYFVDNDSEIKPGKTISSELSCYEKYSSYKIWLSGRISNF